MSHSRFVPTLFALLVLAVTLAGAGPAPAADAYRQEIDAWRRERSNGLAKEDGWLTLVGLFWLQEGANGIGSGADNRVVLPEGRAPERAGRMVRKGKEVRLEVAPGVKVTVAGAAIVANAAGKPISSLALKSDAGGEPTVVQLGSLSFFVIERGERVGVRVKDSASPARASFKGLDYFPADPSWRLEARFEPYEPPKSVPIPNVLGSIDPTPSPGAVVFERGGKTYRLDALDEGDGKLFLIFADSTNGKQTYGAGRFLTADAPRDGKVLVDFNKAYNPPCAFTPFATCPLPPRQNRLALAVDAGEKKFGSGHPGGH